MNKSLILDLKASTSTGTDTVMFLTVAGVRNRFEINDNLSAIRIVIPMDANQTSVKVVIESDVHWFSLGAGWRRDSIFKLSNPTVTVMSTSSEPLEDDSGGITE